MGENLFCPMIHGKCVERECAMWRSSQQVCGFAAPFPVVIPQPGPSDVTINRAVHRITEELYGSATVEHKVREILKDELERATRRTGGWGKGR